MKNELKIVLDFVEKWNKYDEDSEVAEAARVLGESLKEGEL